MAIRKKDAGGLCFDISETSYQAEEDREDTVECDDDMSRIMDSIEDAAVAGIIENINYVYPYEKSLNVPQKVSVSYIKHEAMEEKGVSIASDPRGDRVVPTAGALRGTAVHTAFENLPLDMSADAESINGFLDRLVADGKLSAAERGYIRERDISAFLQSDICRRMAEADARGELFREQPFIISVSAYEIDRAYPKEDRVMVQGIIDAFFTENGRVVVVDYKTDRVDSEQVLTDRYQEQLNYYERALRQLMDVSLSEKVIYSVSLEKEIVL